MILGHEVDNVIPVLQTYPNRNLDSTIFTLLNIIYLLYSCILYNHNIIGLILLLPVGSTSSFESKTASKLVPQIAAKTGFICVFLA